MRTTVKMLLAASAATLAIGATVVAGAQMASANGTAPERPGYAVSSTVNGDQLRERLHDGICDSTSSDQTMGQERVQMRDRSSDGAHEQIQQRDRIHQTD